jgi:putative PIN family toxin of toxin-antitoxin system
VISTVLDTNILASGTLTAGSAPGQILNAWRDGHFALIISDHIRDELTRTLQKPYFQRHLTSRQISDFFELLDAEAIYTPITAQIHGVASHPEDDLTLATAVSAKADYLVTGDGFLLRQVGQSYQGVALVTPLEFLNIL